MPGRCPHVIALPPNVTPSGTEGCVECLRTGSTWVHLRECLTCGHIGCCDSSPRRHARAHAATLDHPVIRSFEPGEDCTSEGRGVWSSVVTDLRFRVMKDTSAIKSASPDRLYVHGHE
jgi:hypothetical protein